jgi:adenylate cyclase
MSGFGRRVAGRLRRHGLRATLMAVGVSAAVLALDAVGFGPLRASDRAGYDAALGQFVTRSEPSAHVAVIAVDEESLEWAEAHHRDDWGAWPFPRFVWGKLARYLANGGARAVVFDVTMSDPQHENYSTSMVEDIHRSGLPFFLGFSTSASERRRLPRVEPHNAFSHEVYARPADAAEEDASAFALDDGEEEGALDAPAPSRATPEQVARSLAFPVVGSRRPRELVAGSAAMHPVRPDWPLVAQLAGYGLVEPEADEDGVMRRTFLAYRLGDNDHVVLPVAAVADLLGARALELEPGHAKLGDRSWRTSPDGSLRIDYGGDPFAMFVTVPFSAVYSDLESQGDDTVPSREWFRDKVVMVGGSAMALQDTKATPFSASSPGYAKQAAVLDGLLSDRFIVDAPFWLGALLTLAVALLSALLLTGVRLAALEVGWPLVVLVAWTVVVGLVMRHGQLYLPWAAPVWAGVVSSLGAVALARLAADQNRELLKRSFERYLDPTLVNQMVESEKLPELKGETREITAFFSDIKGFSTFSESLKEDPQTLVRVLNTYLTRVSTVLLREGGCLDKYIGDAVVCLFGAPVSQTDHAVRACRGALAAQKEVARLREEFRAQGLPDVYTRMGLNSAKMFVGNFGSEQLFNYTAMGDGMNLAARLEGANKAYGSLIMVGPLTHALTRDHVETRELDRVRVAGKTEAVAVYELLALKGELDPVKQQVVALYAEGLAAYRAGRFADGEAHFARALELDPKDGPSRVLRERCRELVAHPPASFDGVVDLDK